MRMLRQRILFSTVRMADLILVVDRGRVVERGAHTKLLAQGGLQASAHP